METPTFRPALVSSTKLYIDDHLSLIEFLASPPAKMAPTGVNSKGVPVHDCSIIAVTSLEPDSDTTSIATTRTARTWFTSPNSNQRRSWLFGNHSANDVSDMASPMRRAPSHKGWNRRSAIAGAMNPTHWGDREYMKCVTFSKTKDHLRWTPLHYAAKKGFAQAAVRLLDDGIPIEARTLEDQTALHIAAAEGHLQVVEVLLNRNANYWANDKQLRTPIALATEKNHLNVAIAFFNMNHNKAHFSEEKSQLLIAAIFTGDKPRLRTLLENHCDPNLAVGGPRPLRVAVEKADAEVVNILLQSGADPALRSADGSLPLATAVVRRSAEIVRLLMKHGANPHAPSAHGKSCFKIALERGDNDIIRLLMERDPKHALHNGEHQSGISMLAIAIDCNNANAVSTLLEGGADPSALEVDGTTPLIRAAFPGRIDVLDLLLRHGADVAGPDSNGILPAQSVVFRAARRVQVVRSGTEDLQKAIDCEKDSIEVLQTLMQYGADLHSADINGKNLLHLSAEAGLKRISLFCLSNRFDILGADSNGWAALHWAAYGGDVSTAQVIKLRGGSTKQTDTNGLTPLMIAAKYCHNEVTILLTNDSDPNHRDSFGHTALYYAAASENLLLVEHLLSNGAMAMEQDYHPISPPSTPSSTSSKGTGIGFVCNTRVSEICKLGATFELRQSHRLPNPSNLKRLLDLGASPNSSIGETPIACLAAMSSSETTMRVLLAAKANINIADRNGQTPLHIAASRGRTGIAEALVAAGASLNARDTLGRTAEDVATRAGQTEVLNNLVAARQAAAANRTTPVKIPRPAVRFISPHGANEASELGKLGLQRVHGLERARSMTPKQRLAGWVQHQERSQSREMEKSASRSDTPVR